MMEVFLGVLLLCSTAFALGGECNSYEREKLNEGYRTCVYKDSMGIPTIGVGFNLKKYGARSKIESVGADYDEVLSGAQCLTDSQIEQLFNGDMATAVRCVQGYLGNYYGSIGETPLSALADMAFNLGCAGLKEFKVLKADVGKKDFGAAGNDMRDSLWCRQVGVRCERDISCMKKGTSQQQGQIRQEDEYYNFL